MTSAPATRERDLTVDVARGAAIILIAVGHVVVGLRTSQIITTEGRANGLMPALYLVHIVVFALLAGLFIEHGVRRYGSKGFLLRRAMLFTWLYLLWGLLQRGMRVVIDATANSSARPVELLRLWEPEGQLWFLPWLLAATALVVVVAPWRSRTRAVLLAVGSVVLGLGTWGWEPTGVVIQGLALTPFLVLGVLVGPRRFTGATSRTRMWLLGAGSLALAAVYLVVAVGTWSYADPTAASPDRSASAILAGVVGTVSGTAALLGLCALVARRRAWARPLAALGRRSMEIYLAHIVALSLARAGLVGLGIEDPLVHLLVGSAAGIGGPLVLWWLASRTGQDWLFGLPRWLQRRLDAAAASPDSPPRPSRADTLGA